MSIVLRARDLRAGYGRTEILHGISLEVCEGEIVTLLGANGAGKTTTLLALAGAIPSQGHLEIFGAPARGEVHDRARQGLAFLPDQRGVIRSLTVEQNFQLAGVPAGHAYETSPQLRPLRNRKVGELSGGEQQIAALTLAICGQPRLILADEMSFGLAPVVVSRMFELIVQAAQRGAAVILVEQYARKALETAHRAYVLQRGLVAAEGPAADLLRDIDRLESSYLGTAPVSSH